MDITSFFAARQKTNTASVIPASITNQMIKSITWDKAQGGTLTLGGQNNQSGIFSLKDASANEIVHMDDTGIQVNNGKITIKNSNNTAVLDATGLISTANFSNQDVFNGSAGQSTASTSLTDVVGSSLNSFTLTRAINVLLIIMGYGYNDAAITSHGADSMQIIIYDSFYAGSVANVNIWGTTTTYTPDGLSFFFDVHNQMVSRTTIYRNMDAGTHTLKLQYQAVNGGTAHLNAFEIGCVLLGS